MDIINLRVKTIERNKAVREQEYPCPEDNEFLGQPSLRYYELPMIILVTRAKQAHVAQASWICVFCHLQPKRCCLYKYGNWKL